MKGLPRNCNQICTFWTLAGDSKGMQIIQNLVRYNITENYLEISIICTAMYRQFHEVSSKKTCGD